MNEIKQQLTESRRNPDILMYNSLFIRDFRKNKMTSEQSYPRGRKCPFLFMQIEITGKEHQSRALLPFILQSVGV